MVLVLSFFVVVNSSTCRHNSTRLLFKLFSELNCKLELLQKDKDQAVEDLQAARQQLGEINEEVSLKSEIVYFII